MTKVVLKSYTKERTAEIIKRLRDGMNKAVLIVENQAKLNLDKTGSEHPQVKTGILRSSITSKVEESLTGEITGIVGTNLPYGKYLEFGHSQTPGRYVSAIDAKLVATTVPPYPWLFPAVEAKKSEIKDALKGSKFKVG